MCPKTSEHYGIAFNMQKGIQNDIVVIDFEKAFDKVAHNTLCWIGLFLGGRSQRVVLEGKSSSSVPVLSAVPQGSVLGRSYFLFLSMTFRSMSPTAL